VLFGEKSKGNRYMVYGLWYMVDGIQIGIVTWNPYTIHQIPSTCQNTGKWHPLWTAWL